MLNTLKFAWSSRRAWWFTATARTRERYARTALGSLWLGVSNLLSVGVLATVYGTVFKANDIKAYTIYLGIGFTAWNAIAGAIQAAPDLFKLNAKNINNSNLNPMFYTLEGWAFHVQTFLQAFVLVIGVLSILDPSILINLATKAIIPLANLLLLIYWIPLLISLLGAYYEDIFQFVPICLQLLFLISPILYDKAQLGSLEWIARINPLYIVLDDFRDSLISGELKPESILIVLLVNAAGIILSVWILEKNRHKLPFLV